MSDYDVNEQGIEDTQYDNCADYERQLDEYYEQIYMLNERAEKDRQLVEDMFWQDEYRKEVEVVKKESHQIEALKKKYLIEYYLGEEKELLTILTKLENKEEFESSDLDWLEKKKELSPLLAVYYQNQAKKALYKYKWNLLKSCSNWRIFSKLRYKNDVFKKYKDDIFKYRKQFSEEGYLLIKDLDSNNKRLKSAILVCKGASLLDINIDAVNKVEKWVKQAIKLNPDSFQARRLLAKVYDIQGKKYESLEEFELAEKIEKKALKEKSRDDEFEISF